MNGRKLNIIQMSWVKVDPTNAMSSLVVVQ